MPTAAAGPPAAERVSVSSAGEQADLPVDGVAVSANGRYAGFVSEAGTLVAGDTNLTYDVFVRDRWRGVPYALQRLQRRRSEKV